MVGRVANCKGLIKENIFRINFLFPTDSGIIGIKDVFNHEIDLKKPGKGIYDLLQKQKKHVSEKLLNVISI